MKKRFINAIVLSAIVGSMVSCNKELTESMIDQQQMSKEEVTKLSATIGNFRSESMGEEPSATRSTIIEDVNGDLQLVWSDKDTLGIFPTSGYQVPFPIASQAGTKNAYFDGGGWGLMSDGTYSAYSPLIGDLYLKKTEIPLVLLTQVQNGNGSFEHLNKYDYMAAVNATVNQSGGIDFNFEHKVAILHMQIRMPQAGTYKYVILETSDKFATEAKLDLSDGTMTMTKQSPIQTMKLENVTVSDSDPNHVLEIYMAILPADLTDKILYTKIYDEDNNCYSTTMQAKNFVAGTIYNSKKIATADLSHSGLPVAIINTPNNQDITSKEEYVENTLISILQLDIMDEFCELTNVKGRGNTTWAAPKKPYAIKFNKKKSLMSLPEDKSWVLLANYYDPTLLRNDLAFYLGNEFSTLDWTPHYQQVDLSLNGNYRGIYQLGEKVKISKKRVNVGDDGFLLEVDAKADANEVTFPVPHIGKPINIKEPDDIIVDDDDYNYIVGFMTQADAALFSDEFLDENEGYKKYIDMDSFVEWYIINEIAKNNDAIFFTSCYMNLKRGGKLKMGPLWDFDIAFGGYPWEPRGSTISNVTSGFYIKNNVQWYSRFFEDPVFVAKVKERFGDYYNNKQVILDYIDARASQLINKVVEENKLWGRITSSTATYEEVKSAYQDKVDGLKTWIMDRLEWLNTEISGL